MIRGASSYGIPWPKNAGDEPTPPKLPQPSTIRVTETPLRPSSRVSTRAILGRTRPVRTEFGLRERGRDLDGPALGDGRRRRVEDLDDVGSMRPGRPVRSSADDRVTQLAECPPQSVPGNAFSTGTFSYGSPNRASSTVASNSCQSER